MHIGLVSWLRRGRTWAGLWISLSLAWLVWTLQLLVAMCALAAILLPTVWRRPKPMKPMRRLPIPIRDGGDIYAVMPDGERVKVEPLAAANHARAWLDVVAGSYVRKMTELPPE